MFTVPAGAQPVPCRRCPQLVYFVRTTAGKQMPVRVDVEGGVAPGTGPTDHGRGTSHFIDCPGADELRNPRGKR